MSQYADHPQRVLYGSEIPEFARGALAYRQLRPASPGYFGDGADRWKFTPPDHGQLLVVYPMLFGGEKLCEGPADCETGFDRWWEYPEVGEGVLALLAWPETGEAPDGSPWQPTAGWGRRGQAGKTIRA